MNMEITQYTNSIANLLNWNYTTVVRPHYRVNEYMMDKYAQKLLRYKNINGIYMIAEDDRDDSDIFTKTKQGNHIHLIASVQGYIDNLRSYIAKGIGVNSKAVLDVQEIKSKDAIIKYVTKNIKKPNPIYGLYI